MATVYTMIRKKLSLFPYHIQLVQSLFEKDYAARVKFAEIICGIADQLNKVIWSNESWLSLSGQIHTRNCVIFTCDLNKHSI